MAVALNQPLALIPEYRHYVWGGQRLVQGPQPTAEAWVVYEKDRVAAGPLAGRTLADVAAEYGAALLGRRPFERTNERFPLLIKLLDANQWLSIQVHPNDAQAARLGGPGEFGKTEAWHILEADAAAQLIAGLRSGTSAVQFEQAVRRGRLLDVAPYQSVRRGDTLLIPAGTLHALGPGLLIYEVQQTSNLTYRVYDWGRPPTPERRLHIEESLAVTNPTATVQPVPCPPDRDGAATLLCACPYFTLELLTTQTQAVALDTAGESFHALTLTAGSVALHGPDWQVKLLPLETMIVPAALGRYRIEPLEAPGRVLKASVAAWPAS